MREKLLFIIILKGSSVWVELQSWRLCFTGKIPRYRYVCVPLFHHLPTGDRQKRDGKRNMKANISLLVTEEP